MIGKDTAMELEGYKIILKVVLALVELTLLTETMYTVLENILKMFNSMSLKNEH